MSRVKELREERGAIYEQMQLIAETAATEKRPWTPEEREKFDKLETVEDGLSQTLTRLEKIEARELEDAESEDRRKQSERTTDRTGVPTARERRSALAGWALGPKRSERHSAALDRCKFDPNNTELNFKLFDTQVRSSAEIEKRAQLSSFGSTIVPASSDVGNLTEGGAAVAQEVMQGVERALLAFGGMREASRVVRSKTGGIMPFPMSNDTNESATVVAQNTTISTTKTITFTQKNITTHKYSSGIIQASIEFIQDASFNFSEWVGEVLGERVARGTNSHFTAGATDLAQPEGITSVLDVDAVGISSGTTNIISYGGLLAVEHSLDPLYRRMPSTRWMFHDSALKAIKGLVDSQGRLLWVPGLSAGEPDTILGYPYTINQAFSTYSTASTAVVLAFGDFSKYVIRDVQDVTLIRLNERYADQGAVGFLTLSRHGGGYLNAGTNPIVGLVPSS